MTQLVLGIDVGGSSVKAGLVEVASGRLHGELIHAPTPQPSPPPALMAVIAGLAARLPGASGTVGIALPSVVTAGIVRTAVELMATRRAPSLLRAIPFDQLTSKALFEKASQGDALALEAFEVTGRILGEKLADMVLFTRPEAIILFGGLAGAGDLILKPTQRAMAASLPHFFKGTVALLPSGVAGTDAAILGAGALIWNELRKRGNDLGSPVPARNLAQRARPELPGRQILSQDGSPKSG